MNDNKFPTKNVGIILVLLSTFINATAQYLLKIGAQNFIIENISISISFLLQNYAIILGFALYAVSSVMFITALKHGPLSEIYPVVSLTFIWVSLVSLYLLNESLTYTKAGGIASVMYGVFLISRGGS